MKFYFAIFLLVLATSCADLNKSDQLKSLSILTGNVEEVQGQISGLEDSLKVYIYKLDSLDEALKSHYSNDTLSIETATSIDKMVSLKELFPALKLELNQIDSLLVVKNDVIHQLEADIVNGAGDRSKYEAYLSFEESELKLLQKNVSVLIETIDLSIDDFNLLYPSVNDYIHSIEVKE